MICDVCGKDTEGVDCQYWEAGKELIPEGLLLTVCKKCDSATIVLDDNHPAKAKTKKLRDYVKLQLKE